MPRTADCAEGRPASLDPSTHQGPPLSGWGTTRPSRAGGLAVNSRTSAAKWHGRSLSLNAKCDAESRGIAN